MVWVSDFFCFTKNPNLLKKKKNIKYICCFLCWGGGVGGGGGGWGW